MVKHILMLSNSAFMEFWEEAPNHWRFKGNYVRGEHTFKVYTNEKDFDNGAICELLSNLMANGCKPYEPKPYNPYAWFD